MIAISEKQAAIPAILRRGGDVGPEGIELGIIEPSHVLQVAAQPMPEDEQGTQVSQSRVGKQPDGRG